MKNRLIILAVLASNTLLFAGGDVSSTEVNHPKVEVPPTNISDTAFYVGIGLSSMEMNNDLFDERFESNAIMLQAGYQYNNYLAIEGRYTHNVGDLEYKHGNDHRVNGGIDISDYPADFTNIAIYIKPMYKIENFSLYALLGYGEVELSNIPQDDVDRAEDGFQWGLGLAYDVSKQISIYADYVTMYDDKGFDYRATDADIKVDAFTVGISYKF